MIQLPMTKTGLSWTRLLRELAARNIMHLLIEGGAGVATSALNANIVNRVALFYAPLLIGGSNALTLFGGRGPAHLTDAHRLTHTKMTRIGNDFLIIGYIPQP